jgi:hypothetical protein
VDEELTADDDADSAVRMNIFYINVIEQNAGWGAECFVNYGFLQHGHLTQTLDYRKHRAYLATKFLGVTDFDVMLLQRGDGFPLALVAACRRPRFFWASELVSRCRDQDRLLQSGLFDHVFVRTPQCVSQIVAAGWMPAEKLSVLLSGYDEQTHSPLSCVKDIEVVFVGTMLPRRLKILERLRARFPIEVLSVFGDELAQTFNRAKIVLNLHAEDYLDTETRIYEALGCGAFVLTERLSGESPFVSGRHLVEVADLDELEERVAYYLSNEQERMLIAEEGHREAMRHHTYRERAREIAEIMERFVPLDRFGVPALSVREVRRYARKQWLGRLLGKVRR